MTTTSVSRSSARPEVTPSESAARERRRAIDGAPTVIPGGVTPGSRADLTQPGREEHREVLEDLGFATRLATIKAADVNAQALTLRAAGVDPERLLPDPGPGRAELRVEVKG